MTAPAAPPSGLTGETAPPLLAPGAGGGRALFVVIAIMCALACFAALAARGAYRAAETWSADMRSAVTVRVLAPADEGAAERAAVALRRVEGVRGARAMGRERAQELLQPWLGTGALPRDVPLPRLIEVEVDPRAPDAAARARATLSDLGFTAEVDDHRRWIAEVERATGLVQIGALLAVLLLGGAAAAAVTLATRALLTAQTDVVGILHLVGAQDSFVAGAVQRAVFLQALRAGAVGAAVAGATALALVAAAQVTADAVLGEAPLLSPADVWIVLATPLAAALTAMVTARATAMAVLKDAP